MIWDYYDVPFDHNIQTWRLTSNLTVLSCVVSLSGPKNILTVMLFVASDLLEDLLESQLGHVVSFIMSDSVSYDICENSEPSCHKWIEWDEMKWEKREESESHASVHVFVSPLVWLIVSLYPSLSFLVHRYNIRFLRRVFELTAAHFHNIK